MAKQLIINSVDYKDPRGKDITHGQCWNLVTLRAFSTLPTGGSGRGEDCRTGREQLGHEARIGVTNEESLPKSKHDLEE